MLGLLGNKIFSPKVRLQLLDKLKPNQTESTKDIKKEQSVNINSSTSSKSQNFDFENILQNSKYLFLCPENYIDTSVNNLKAQMPVIEDAKDRETIQISKESFQLVKDYLTMRAENGIEKSFWAYMTSEKLGAQSEEVKTIFHQAEKLIIGKIKRNPSLSKSINKLEDLDLEINHDSENIMELIKTSEFWESLEAKVDLTKSLRKYLDKEFDSGLTLSKRNVAQKDLLGLIAMLHDHEVDKKFEAVKNESHKIKTNNFFDLLLNGAINNLAHSFQEFTSNRTVIDTNREASEQFASKYRPLIEFLTNADDASDKPINIWVGDEGVKISDEGSGMDSKTTSVKYWLPFTTTKEEDESVGKFGEGAQSGISLVTDHKDSLKVDTRTSDNLINYSAEKFIDDGEVYFSIERSGNDHKLNSGTLIDIKTSDLDKDEQIKYLKKIARYANKNDIFLFKDDNQNPVKINDFRERALKEYSYDADNLRLLIDEDSSLGKNLDFSVAQNSYVIENLNLDLAYNKKSFTLNTFPEFVLDFSPQCHISESRDKIAVDKNSVQDFMKLINSYLKDKNISDDNKFRFANSAQILIENSFERDISLTIGDLDQEYQNLNDHPSQASRPVSLSDFLKYQLETNIKMNNYFFAPNQEAFKDLDKEFKNKKVILLNPNLLDKKIFDKSSLFTKIYKEIPHGYQKIYSAPLSDDQFYSEYEPDGAFNRDRKKTILIINSKHFNEDQKITNPNKYLNSLLALKAINNPLDANHDAEKRLVKKEKKANKSNNAKPEIIRRIDINESRTKEDIDNSSIWGGFSKEKFKKNFLPEIVHEHFSSLYKYLEQMNISFNDYDDEFMDKIYELDEDDLSTDEKFEILEGIKEDIKQFTSEEAKKNILNIVQLYEKAIKLVSENEDALASYAQLGYRDDISAKGDFLTLTNDKYFDFTKKVLEIERGFLEKYNELRVSIDGDSLSSIIIGDCLNDKFTTIENGAHQEYAQELQKGIDDIANLPLDTVYEVLSQLKQLPHTHSSDFWYSGLLKFGEKNNLEWYQRFEENKEDGFENIKSFNISDYNERDIFKNFIFLPLPKELFKKVSSSINLERVADLEITNGNKFNTNKIRNNLFNKEFWENIFNRIDDSNLSEQKRSDLITLITNVELSKKFSTERKLEIQDRLILLYTNKFSTVNDRQYGDIFSDLDSVSLSEVQRLSHNSPDNIVNAIEYFENIDHKLLKPQVSGILDYLNYGGELVDILSNPNKVELEKYQTSFLISDWVTAAENQSSNDEPSIKALINNLKDEESLKLFTEAITNRAKDKSKERAFREVNNVVGGADTHNKKSVGIRELINNSIDAINEFSSESKDINANVFKEKNDKSEDIKVSVRDGEGMPPDTSLNRLLRPKVSDKGTKQGLIGEKGQGFWLNLHDKVAFKTSKNDLDFVQYYRLTPLDRAGNITYNPKKVYDARCEVSYIPREDLKTEEEQKHYGTLIETNHQSRFIELDTAILKRDLVEEVSAVSSELAKIFLNNEKVNDTSSLKKVAVNLNDAFNTKINLLLDYRKSFRQNGFLREISPEKDKVFIESVAPEIWDILGEFAIELPNSVKLMKNRTDIAPKSQAVHQSICDNVDQIACKLGEDFMEKGTISFSLFPYDLFDFSSFHNILDKEAVTDTREAVESLDNFSNYLMHAKVYSVDETKLSILDLIEAYIDDPKIDLSKIPKNIQSRLVKGKKSYELALANYRNKLESAGVASTHRTTLIPSFNYDDIDNLDSEKLRLLSVSKKAMKQFLNFSSYFTTHSNKQLKEEPKLSINYIHNVENFNARATPKSLFTDNQFIEWNLNYSQNLIKSFERTLDKFEKSEDKELFIKNLNENEINSIFEIGLILIHELAHIYQNSDEITHNPKFTEQMKKIAEKLGTGELNFIKGFEEAMVQD
ncbi:MAG: hypothetical protein HRT47_11845 [Candidatus Caenarcaniphilales bacterium]|nr:hypothetical protein [Candidatus Caenarcaniphilales bacterium]